MKVTRASKKRTPQGLEQLKESLQGLEPQSET